MCGMSEDEFWDVTPKYLAARLYAVEEAQKLTWEQARYISFHALKQDHKGRIKKVTDLGKFPWELQNIQFAPMTEEEKADLRKFEADSDLILKQTNPAAYAAYIAGKEHKNAK